MKPECYPNMTAALYLDAIAADAAVSELRKIRPGTLEVRQFTHGAPKTTDAVDAVFRVCQKPHEVGATPASPGATAIPTLFVSPPVVGPLIVMGYGSLFGDRGTVRCLRIGRPALKAMVEDALDAGCHVVIVRAAHDDIHRRVKYVLDKSVYAGEAPVDRPDLREPAPPPKPCGSHKKCATGRAVLIGDAAAAKGPGSRST
jgi:hypothetical protein